jgi:hypothetical protein
MAEIIKKEVETMAISPRKFIEEATEKAAVLAEIIEKQKVYINIRNRKYVRCEGWTTLARMMGYIPTIKKVEVVYDKDGNIEKAIATAALVDIRTGIEFTTAESMCSVKEKNWTDRDEYAIRSMAQTRAVSKVCRLALSWVMVLAGFEATPAEEMLEENETNSITIDTSKPQQPIQTQQSIQTYETNPSQHPKYLSEAQVKYIQDFAKRKGVEMVAIETHIGKSINDWTNEDLNEALKYVRSIKK